MPSTHRSLPSLCTLLMVAACANGPSATAAPTEAAAMMPSAPPQVSEITAEGPAGRLSGTLTLAAGTTHTAIIIPGSGPTDRDGNGPLIGRSDTYRLLAEGLAAQGVSSVRIDKRGMFGSAIAGQDANAVTMADYAADIAAWVATAKAETGASCVWLMSHSEGGLVALLSANTESASDLCGLVLLATPGRPAGTVLREQLAANQSNRWILDAALAAIDALEAGQRVDVGEEHPAVQSLFNPAVQGFLISMFAVDPPALVLMSGLPILAIQGTEDLQVSLDGDGAALANAASTIVLEPFDGMNHMLRTVPAGDRGANLAAYSDPNLPLADGLIDLIADWIKAD